MSTTTAMASAILNPPYLSQTPSASSSSSSSSSSTSVVVRKPNFSNSLGALQRSYSKTSIARSSTWVPQLGLPTFPTWDGLRRNGCSISQKSCRLERRRKCKRKGVFASLFGVGAPEALVIGVVALLVFGPKGLAEVARNLGKTLRAFQPTIRELQEVSREFKSTLEKEIGLDELKNPLPANYTSTTPSQTSSTSAATPQESLATETTPADTTTEGSKETSTPPAVTTEGSQETGQASAITTEDSQATAPAVTLKDSQPTGDPTNGSASQSKAYSSDELLKITEEQLKTLQQKEPTTPEPLTAAQDNIQEVATGTPPAENPKTEN